MDVKIYKPSKNAMQSGRGNTQQWVLEYDAKTSRNPEPLMGWTSSDDTLGQVRLEFETQEAAIRFAEEKNWNYTVFAEQIKKVKPRNYGDNFKYIPPTGEKSA